MPPYRKKTYKKKFVKKSTRRFKKTSVRSVKKIVKAAISRAAENKNRQFYGSGTILSVSNVTGSDNAVIALSPRAGGIQIDQGTGSGGRIGNSITTKSVMFKGTLTPLPYDATTNPNPAPTQIKMFIFYDKRDPVNYPTPMLNADFFQFNNSAKGFANNLTDLWAPINEDVYRVLYSRTFKLGYADYSGTEQNATFNSNQQSYTNNDFKLNANFRVNVTKYLIKKVKYNDNNSIPTTRGLFCMFVPLYANGLAITTATVPAQVQFMIDYNYEDV